MVNHRFSLPFGEYVFFQPFLKTFKKVSVSKFMFLLFWQNRNVFFV